jgi:hypothetical protein
MTQETIHIQPQKTPTTTTTNTTPKIHKKQQKTI